MCVWKEERTTRSVDERECLENWKVVRSKIERPSLLYLSSLLLLFYEPLMALFASIFFDPSRRENRLSEKEKKGRKEKAETIWTRRRGIIAFWNKRCFYPPSVTTADDIIHFYRQLNWICNIVILYAFKNWKTVLFSFIEFIRYFKIN